MSIRIETQNHGPFEIDLVGLNFYQVRGDLGCPMVPAGEGRWICDVPMGCKYLVTRCVAARCVEYGLFQMCDDRNILIGEKNAT